MNALHYVAQHGFDREAGLLVEAGINIHASDNVSYVITVIVVYIKQIKSSH